MDNLRTLYDILQRDGYDVPQEYEKFSGKLAEDKNSRESLYAVLKNDNYDVPDDYGHFSMILFGAGEKEKAPDAETMPLNGKQHQMKGGFGAGATGVPFTPDITFGKSKPGLTSGVRYKPTDNPLAFKPKSFSERNLELIPDQLYNSADIEKAVAAVFENEKSKAEKQAEAAQENFNNGATFVPSLATGITRGAIDAENTDPESIIGKVYDKLRPRLSALIESRVNAPSTSGTKPEQAVREQVEKEVQDHIRSLIAGKYIAEKTPVNASEYILGSAAKDNVLSMLGSAIVRKAGGSSGAAERLEDEAYGRYGEKAGMLERIGAGVATLVADAPAFAFTGGLGSAAGRGMVQFAGKPLASNGLTSFAGKVASEAGKRSFTSSLSGRIITGAVNSGVTLGGYDAVSETARQMRYGEYNFGNIVGATGKGAAIGALVAPIGITGRYITRASGKAVKASADVGALGLESAVFAMPAVLDKIAGGEHVELDEMGEEFGVSIATLGMLKLKNAGRLRKEIQSRYYSTEAGSMKLTGLDKEILDSRGYGVRDLFKTEKLDNTEYHTITERGVKASKPETASGKVLADTEILAGYENAMRDPGVPLAVKVKLAYLIEGRIVTNVPVVYGSTIEERDGRHFVTSMNAEGRPIETKEYRTKGKASRAFEKLQDISQRNSIEATENICDRYAQKTALYKACAESGDPGSLFAEYMGISRKEEKQRTPKEQSLYTDISAKAGKYFDRQAVSGEIKSRVGGGMQVDIDKAVVTPAKQRTDVQQSAIDRYMDELRSKFMRPEKHEDSGVRLDAKLLNGRDVTIVSGEPEIGADGKVSNIHDRVYIKDSTGKVSVVEAKDISSVTKTPVVTIEDMIKVYNYNEEDAEDARSIPDYFYKKELDELNNELSQSISYSQSAGEKPRHFDYWKEKFDLTDPSDNKEQDTPPLQEQTQAQTQPEDSISSLPRTKEGNIDFDSLTPAQLFEYTRQTESEETAVSDARDMLNNIDTQIKEVEANIKKSIGGKRVALRENLNNLKAQRSEIESFLPKENTDDAIEPLDDTSVSEVSENKDEPLENNRGEILEKEGNILNLPQENKETNDNKYQEGLQVSDQREDHGGNDTPVLRGDDTGVYGNGERESGESNRGDGGIRLRGDIRDYGDWKLTSKFSSDSSSLRIDNEFLDSLLDSHEIKHTSQRVLSATPESFYNTISSQHLENPDGWMVSVHDKNYYKSAKLFLTEDGKSGIAISTDGDIVSLFSSVGGDSRMEKLMLFALANGGKKLDCFDKDKLTKNSKGLPDIYSRYGFETVSTVPFNKEFAPDGWNENAGEPPIIFMVYNGKPVEDVVKGYDRKSRADRTGLKEFEDYSAAMNYRDSLLKAGKQENKNTFPHEMPYENKETVYKTNSEHGINTNPTEAQKEAGNYKMGHIKVDGYEITIENPKGSKRKGVDPNGNEWSVVMNNTYGYIKGTKGVDGDQIDIFLSNNPENRNVYVIDQVNKDGSFDEHKVMYGFNGEDEARQAYLSNYEDGWTGLGSITGVSKKSFKEWIKSSKRKTKLFSEYSSVKEKKVFPLTEELYAEKRSKEIQVDNPDMDEIKAYNNAIDEYPSYIHEKIKSGELEDLYASASIGDRVKLGDIVKSAGFETSDISEKANNEKKITDNKYKNGDAVSIKFYDGTIVNGRVVSADNGKVSVRSFENNRVYNVDESRIVEKFDESSIRFRDGNEYTREEKEILSIAKANGTYLKAPNGEPTKLTEHQWLQVRTKAFKEWFGDWEKAARIEKLRQSKPIEITHNNEYEFNRKSAKDWLKENIRGEYINADTGDKIEVSKVGINEVTAHGSQDESHLKSLAGIPHMIERSVFIDEIPNIKVHDKYDSYRYYVCGLQIDGTDYTAKIVIGVKGDSKYYDHHLSEIEKGALIENLNGLSNSVALNQNSSVSGIKDKRLLSILQTNFSKVLDVNGEPLVVYHGSRSSGFDVFEENNGIYFTDSQNVGKVYSNGWGVSPWGGMQEGMYRVYLDMRNPIIIDAGGKDWDSLEVTLNGEVLNSSEEIVMHIREKGLQNDGVIVKNVVDGDTGNQIGPNYVVLSPGQAKDAFANKGTFSSQEESILYRQQESGIISEKKSIESRLAELERKFGVPVERISISEITNPAIKERAASGAKAWYDTNTGKVSIITDNIVNADDAAVSYIHEIVAHKGLRDMLGAKHYSEFMQQVYNSMDINTRIEYNSRYDSPEIAADEYIADVCEEMFSRENHVSGKFRKAWNRIVGIFRNFFRKLFNLKMNDTDIEYLLWQSAQHLRGNKKSIIYHAQNSVLKDEVESARNYRGNLTEKEIIERDNVRFNDELQQQIDGKLPKGHVYKLGYPGENLKNAGVSDLSIELSPALLESKSDTDYINNHPFELSEVKNLVNAIQNPIAVFDSKTRTGAKVILTELKHNGINFVVALIMNVHPKGFRRNIEVNDIRSLYPKNYVRDIVDWINRGDLLRYANKTKALNWLTQQQYHPAEVESPIRNLDIATKIIERFENYKLNDNNLRLRGYGDNQEDSIISDNENKLSVTVGNNGYTSNEKLIIESKSRGNGTYLKAPNGEPTLLTPEQWLKVRTKEFKNWFGGWEKSSRIEKLRRSKPIEITGKEIEPSEDLKQYKKNALEYGKNLRGEYVNRDTGEKIFLGKNGIKEILHHDYKNQEQLQSIVAIPQIIENSIYVDSEPNSDVKVDAEKFDYYFSGLKINNIDYTVRSVFVTLKDGRRYYDHKLTQIEKGNLIDLLFGTTPGFNQINPLSSVKDIKLRSILQPDFSKALDANGEPLSSDVDEFNSYNVLYRDAENKGLTNEKNIESRLMELEREFGVLAELVGISEINNPVIKGRAERGAKAWYDTNTGKVSIITDNIINAGDAAISYIHEVIAHKGLRDMLGAERHSELMQAVYEGMDDAARIKYDSRYTNPHIAADEYIADLCEKIYDGSNTLSVKLRRAWNRIVGIFRNFFRKLFNLKINDTDIEYLLWQSSQRLRNNNGSIIYHAQKSVLKQEAESARNYRGILTEKEIIERDNARFNEELQRQIDGTLPIDHVYKLGYPGGILRNAGIPEFPVYLVASTLSIKSSKDYKSNHPFDLSEVRNLVEAIQYPIAVFESEELNGKKVVLTELKDKRGKDFVAVIGVSGINGRSYLEINKVISLYPKDSVRHIAEWFDSTNKQGLNMDVDLLLWADTKKASQWLPTHSSHVNVSGLSSRRIANKIKRFESSKPEDNNLMFRGYGDNQENSITGNKDILPANNSDNHYSDNEKLIIQSESIGNDTYLKAPNGNSTLLTPEQWLLVRTREFKNWFGDWEKLSRIEKLRKSKPIEITGKEIEPSEDLEQYKKNALEYGKNLRGEYVNRDTGEKIFLTVGNKRGGIREILQHDYKNPEHLQSIAAIPDIIEDSIFITELPNDDIGRYQGVKTFRYYVCGLRINDVDYTVKAVVALQNNGNRYYDHSLTQIEKGELLSKNPTIQKAGIDSDSPLYEIKDKRLLSILQTGVSKALDVNGEPLSSDVDEFNSYNALYRNAENKGSTNEKNIESRLTELEREFRVPVERVIISEINNPGIKERALRGVKAWYDTNTGKVSIVTDNIINAGDAAISYIHEVIAHKGLRDMLGAERHLELMQMVYESMNPAVREAYTRKYVNPDMSAGEYIADICEKIYDNSNNTLSGNLGKAWNRIVGIFRNFFRKLFKLKINDTDIEYMLWQSSQHLRGNKKSIVYQAQNSVLKHEVETARNYRGNLNEKKIIERDNTRFNNELRQQIDGKLPKGYIYKLGYPGENLKSAGVPDLPVELSSSLLSSKSNINYVSNHPFGLPEVKNLVNAIQNPIAVFDSKTHIGSKVILTELKHNGTNFVVALQVNTNARGYGRNLTINSIRSVYPKDNVQDIIEWINRGDLLRYADKTKVLNWLTQQRSNSADVESPIKNLDVATKIIERFENPKSDNNNLRVRGYGDNQDNNIINNNENKLSVTAGNNGYTGNEKLIIESKSRGNGTYLKAPNGEFTLLTPEQWLKVRTKEFKNWFGDWEKPSRIEKLRRSKPIEITGKEIEPSEDLKQYKKNALEYGKNLRGKYINEGTGIEIEVNGNSIKEVLHHDYKNVEHLQSVAAIPGLIEKGIYIISEKNTGEKDIDSFDYYVSGLRIGGVDYTVKYVISNKNDGSRYYDHKLTKIEKEKLLDLSAISSAESASTSPFSDIKDKRLLSILQPDFSKALDVNGEPLSSDVDEFNSYNLLYRDAENKVSTNEKNIESRLTELEREFRVPVERVIISEINNPGIKERALRGAKAWYDTNTGKVSIITDNIINAGDAAISYIHEVIAHKGLRDMLGAERHSELMQMVYESMDPDVREAYTRKYVDPDMSAGEYIADICEKIYDNSNNTLSGNLGRAWNRIVGIFRNFFRKLFKLKINDTDIEYMLWQSSQHLKGNKRSVIYHAQNSALKQEVESARNYRGNLSEKGITERDNTRFNEELQQQIDGTLPKWHVYKLGYTGEVLKSGGIPDLPIELSSSLLNTKSNTVYVSNHPYDLSEVKDLVNYIQNPIAVLNSKTRAGSKVILTELKHNDVNFVMALQVNANARGFRRSIEINDIRSVYTKDNIQDIVDWINRGDLLRYVDKTKALNWLTQQRSNSAEVESPIKNLDVATKIIERFENPKSDNNNLRFRGYGDNQDNNIINNNENKLSVTAGDNGYTGNEKLIIESKSIGNGTYLKAPNGESTLLTLEQWLLVRTREFKNWFGDWEKPSRIEKLRRSKPIEITGKEIEPSEDLKQYKKNALEFGKNLRGEYVNRDTGENISISKSGIKEFLNHDFNDPVQLQSVAAIPGIIENSIYVETVENEDLLKNIDVKEYHYYVCGLKIGEIDHTVKLTVGEKGGKKYYDHSLTEIEKGKLIDITSPNGFKTKGDKSSLSSTSIKDTKLLSILQTNFSKPLDVNGEPMPEAIAEYNDMVPGILYRIKEVGEGKYIDMHKRNTTAVYKAISAYIKEHPGEFTDYSESSSSGTNSKYIKFRYQDVSYSVRFSNHTKTGNETGAVSDPVRGITVILSQEDASVTKVKMDLSHIRLTSTQVKEVLSEVARYNAGEANRFNISAAKVSLINDYRDGKPYVPYSIDISEYPYIGTAIEKYFKTDMPSVTDTARLEELRRKERRLMKKMHGVYAVGNYEVKVSWRGEIQSVAYTGIGQPGPGRIEKADGQTAAREVENYVAGLIAPLKEEYLQVLSSIKSESAVRAVYANAVRLPFYRTIINATPEKYNGETGLSEIFSGLEKLEREFGVPVGHAAIHAISDPVIKKQALRGAKAWYDVAAGAVFIITDNIADSGDAMISYVHEVVAHKGLRDMLGAERHRELMSEIFKSLDSETQKYYKGIYGSELNAAEEYIAGICEKMFSRKGSISGNIRNAWNRLVGIIRDFFRKLFHMELNDKDIELIIWHSAQHLRNRTKDILYQAESSVLKHEARTTGSYNRSLTEEKIKEHDGIR